MKKRNRFDNRKYLMTTLAAVIVAAAGIRAVSAFFADADTASNEVTIGSNDVRVEEEFDPPAELLPGTSFTKKVSVANTGLVDCYVRVKAVFTTSDMEQWCQVDYDTDHWAMGEDGFWYYTDVLAVGESTPELFTSVELSEDIPEASIEAFDILIYVESYQSYGFENYADAWASYGANRPEAAPTVDGQ